VVDIETVDIRDGPAIFLQEGGQKEESQGLSLEVIGGQVIHPRINQEEIFPLLSHRASSMVRSWGSP